MKPLFQVILSRKAEKSIRQLPKHYQRKIVELLLVFRENPIPAEYYDIKKLKGQADTYRSRIGDIRTIYEINWNQKEIHVLLVKPREKAYE
jgi:mRNA-degrading endonuclease RelE of RelBE toxin-antitoxin system